MSEYENEIERPDKMVNLVEKIIKLNTQSQEQWKEWLEDYQLLWLGYKEEIIQKKL